MQKQGFGRQKRYSMLCNVVFCGVDDMRCYKLDGKVICDVVTFFPPLLYALNEVTDFTEVSL